MNCIEFRNVDFSYRDKNLGEVPVLKDFSFLVNEGEILAITGESGTGKTTIIKLLLGDLKPDKGKILIDGEDIASINSRDLPYYRRKIGVVFQDYCLVEDINVYDNIKLAVLAAGGRGKDVLKKIYSLLKLIKMENMVKRFPKTISGGECQKVCLARALVNNPKVLLCDEPTGNLSPGDSREIFGLLNIIRNQGIKVVVATHDLETLKSLDNIKNIDLSYMSCQRREA